MFFKRLSRSRANSASYVDNDYERSPSATTPQLQSSYDDGRPPSSFKNLVQPVSPVDQKTAPSAADGRMFAAQQQQQRGNGPMGNGIGGPRVPQSGRDSGYVDDMPSTPLKSEHTAPDLLTRAFNEAVRPFQEKIDALEQQLHDMQNFLDEMESQRMDVYAWIDKRGLRPDVPPTIAKQMDSTPDAASALNAQLDRKITIVNFDLHRLQDDLNDSISSSHFASAMAKFLPDIQRLADIRTGPRYAYELIIKLVGNLNSHGGLEAAGAGSDDEVDEDRRARSAFYERMDDELVDVIRRRSGEGEDWPMAREVKRLEKNGAYLKNLGIDSYFPRSLELMRRESGNAFAPAGAQGTPPRYS